LHFAEVLYFFLVTKNDLQYTLAAVYAFSDPDPHVLEVSYRTLRLCTYLGVNGIRIIDAKWIMDVIGMVPFKDTQ